MSEISAVDRPAQSHAKMTIMKRDADEYWKRDFTSDQRDNLASTGAAMSDGSFPIVTTADLKNAISAYGRAKDPAKAKSHIISRAKSLGATSTLPDGWVAKSHHGHERIEDMTEAEIQKMIADAVKTATTDITKSLTDVSEALVIAKLSKPEQDYLSDASPKDKAAYLAADAPGRKKIIAADAADDPDDADTAKRFEAAVVKEVDKRMAKNADIAKNDETFEHEGTVIRKSVVGEDQFKVIKSLSETNEINAFTKRAETEIPALPGTSIAKAKALRAVSKLAKEDREVVEAMLKSGNAAMKTQLTTLGKDGNGDDTAEGELEKMVATYMTTDKTVSKAVAYTKVLETAAGKALYAKSITDKTPRAA